MLAIPHYDLSAVEKAIMPDGEQSQDWYRYILSSGVSQIIGFHRGTLEEVTEYAIGSAEAFNLRNLTGKSARDRALTLKLRVRR